MKNSDRTTAGRKRKMDRKGRKMIRGAQKKMIVVKTGDSRLFEEAYFVLRREYEGGGDMVAEANRLIEGCGGRGKGVSKRTGRRLVSLALFLGGALSGGGVIGLLWLLL